MATEDFFLCIYIKQFLVVPSPQILPLLLWVKVGQQQKKRELETRPCE